jgi:hypothetical protein
MPKTDIDYSNTIFYKIYCKDETNKDLYVGHTTNFVQRKHAHKASCGNSKSANYSQKVYKTIREYGGWNNWIMEIIAFHNCKDGYDARKIEQEYYEKLGATLNSIQPIPPMKKEKIPIKKEYTNQCNTPKIFNGTTFKYHCENCNYYTNKSSSYNKHLSTNKHINPISNNNNTFNCLECSKVYTSRVGLWKHKHICKPVIPPVVNNDSIPTIDNQSLIQELLKQNQELKDLILEERRDFHKLFMDLTEKITCVLNK